MRVEPIAVAALLVLASVAPAAVAATETAETQAQGEAYAGTNVEFQATSNAVVDYAVNGDVVVENVTVQSASEAGVGAGADVGLDAAADFAASDLSVTSNAEASAATSVTVESESGARIESHDNERGIMVVTSEDGEQVVRAGVASDSEAEAESENRVVVRKDDGATGTFIVVGDGEVTVNENGNVAAQVGEDGKLVYRQYEDERDDGDETQERLIANGTATAEVYYQQAQESGDDGGQRTADVVEYGSDTTVEVTERSESELNMTVERTQSEGKVVITHVSESAMEGADNAQDVEVYVDGEAAAEAESYSQVVAATEGDGGPAYTVRQSSNADAASEVVVGIDHFSERSVSMQSGGNGDDGGITGGAGPGFGVVAALAAVGGALVAARRL
jgi:hypothetical protein